MRNIDKKLFAAIKEGNLEDVKNLCETFAVDLGVQDDMGQTVLHITARHNDYPALEDLWTYFVNRGADPMICDYTDEPAFFDLMLDDANDFIIAAMIAQGLPLDVQNARGETALMRAAEYGQYILVDLLLSHGAHPDYKDCDGYHAHRMSVERVKRHVILSGYGRCTQSLEKHTILGVRGPYKDMSTEWKKTKSLQSWLQKYDERVKMNNFEKVCYTDQFPDLLAYLAENCTLNQVRDIVDMLPAGQNIRYKTEIGDVIFDMERQQVHRHARKPKIKFRR